MLSTATTSSSTNGSRQLTRFQQLSSSSPHAAPGPNPQRDVIELT